MKYYSLNIKNPNKINSLQLNNIQVDIQLIQFNSRFIIINVFNQTIKILKHDHWCYQDICIKYIKKSNNDIYIGLFLNRFNLEALPLDIINYEINTKLTETDKKIYNAGISGTNPKITEEDIKSIIMNNRLEHLKYLYKEKLISIEDGTRLCNYAAQGGSLECLMYLHQHKFPWNYETCQNAAENGHLECLKYAHENGCLWHGSTCNYAAFNGHLECLKYAHQNKCPLNEDTCWSAAFNGHLECLKYAHAPPSGDSCPWNTYTCSFAALNGHLECLKYAIQNGCPYNRNDSNIQKYLHFVV